jgi:hypothetical protein
MNVREAAFDSVVIKAQSFVIETEDVEDRGVKIINCGDSFHGLVAEFISRTIAERSFYSGSGQPGGEAVGIMITTTRALLESRHTAEFGAENDESVVE